MTNHKAATRSMATGFAVVAACAVVVPPTVHAQGSLLDQAKGFNTPDLKEIDALVCLLWVQAV